MEVVIEDTFSDPSSVLHSATAVMVGAGERVKWEHCHVISNGGRVIQYTVAPEQVLRGRSKWRGRGEGKGGGEKKRRKGRNEGDREEKGEE